MQLPGSTCDTAAQQAQLFRIFGKKLQVIRNLKFFLSVVQSLTIISDMSESRKIAYVSNTRFAGIINLSVWHFSFF